MREQLPGYDTKYRSTGVNPEVDKAVDKLNDVLKGHDGGISCLDDEGNTVSEYTDDVVLELPDDLPPEIATEARAAALGVLQAMHKHPSK
ncbi:MAG: hypothetical protein QF741_01600 [Candidatus Peribacteraceae bacterium]|jgi:hypothetical protein|nr:hypothetical protein [Candidatus Peribacteraceae bacterium]MDP7454522.1 hypothetical protein [Candidatus Peribacteraceae bacterium]MDP7645892.1 hypothetical protein [Candidatus Peribacteraceae bacterium]|tara:strand:+ start:185 stop:454 length:270 start_codon:yes stop_codon:yes gene_type:complete